MTRDARPQPRRGHPLVALLLTPLWVFAACSGSTSATAPADAPAEAANDAPAPATKPEAPPAEQEPEAANFADPKQADDPPPAAKPSTPEDPALAARIKERFGADCRLERSCGELLGIDCKSAVDGPYHYVERSDLKTVATCGGACMGGKCTDCPPKRWTCPTY